MAFAGCEELLNEQDPSLIPIGFFDHLVHGARANWSAIGIPQFQRMAKLPAAQHAHNAAIEIMGSGWAKLPPQTRQLL
jgi:hypothetical protein